jgi:hypothetical protein
MKRSLKALLLRRSFRSYVSGRKYGYKNELQYRLLDISRVLGERVNLGRRFVIPFIHVLRFLRITNFKISSLVLNQLAWNPPVTAQPEKYEVFLLVGPRDLSIFPLSLASLKTQLSSTSRQVTVVCPESIREQISKDIKNYQNGSIQIEILTDECLLEQFNLKRNDFPNSHVFMQVAKFLLAIHANSEKSLILDGDTIFLRNRSWDSGSSEILVIPPEFEITQAEFSKSLLQLPRVSRLGYTTQSQLLSKTKVQRLFQQLGGVRNVSQEFGKAYIDHQAGINPTKFPCEWQLYGDWLRRVDNSPIRYLAYNNISESRAILEASGLYLAKQEEIEEFISQIQDKYPELGSLSFHHYK